MVWDPGGRTAGEIELIKGRGVQTPQDRLPSANATVSRHKRDDLETAVFAFSWPKVATERQTSALAETDVATALREP